MNIVIIVQARMGSSRLPGKMMKMIAGKPVIAHVIERARLSRRANDLWLATTDAPADDVLAAWAKDNGVNCYRGSENDVLDRYYKAATSAKAEVIVRVTGDCPLADYQVIDRVIDAFVNAHGAYDYVSNTNPPTFPDGLDVEVVSFTALEKAWEEARLQSEREHVTPYIWKHPEMFRLFNVTCQLSGGEADFSRHRWTLDTPEDFAFLTRVIETCNEAGHFCGLSAILSIVQAHPEWQGINAGFERNEGYKKSVKEDS